MDTIEFFVSPAPGPAYYPLQATIHTSYLRDLVLAACVQLHGCLDPRSVNYIEPGDYVGQKFDRVADILADRSLMPRNALSGQNIYNAIWAQVELLSHYAELRNYRGPKSWMVGEEISVVMLVHNTLKLAHNWKVRCIEDTHQKNGSNFGSATGWQRINIYKPVSSWPEAYNFPNAIEELLVLPCER